MNAERAEHIETLVNCYSVLTNHTSANLAAELSGNQGQGAAHDALVQVILIRKIAAKLTLALFSLTAGEGPLSTIEKFAVIKLCTASNNLSYDPIQHVNLSPATNKLVVAKETDPEDEHE